MSARRAGFILGIFLTSLVLNCFAASSCREAVLDAGPDWKYFTSPNYPGKFSTQTQCNWIIRAPKRYRVELTFAKFYLLGSANKKKCFTQHVIIRDIFSGVADGRYCGNTIPPDLVSAGRSVRVTLESNAVRLSRLFYQGFRAKYRASRQPSSFRLRDSQGKWKLYRVKGGDVIIITTTTASTIQTRNPNEVDDNNNADIDAANNEVNNRNINNNEMTNKRKNHLNLAPVLSEDALLITKLTSVTTTTHSLPPRRIPSTLRNTDQERAPKPYLPSPGRAVIIHGGSDDSNASADSVVIICSVVGGIIFFVLLVMLVAWRIRKKPSVQKNSSAIPATSSNQVISTNATNYVYSTKPADSIEKKKTVASRQRTYPDTVNMYPTSRAIIDNQLPGYSEGSADRTFSNRRSRELWSRDRFKDRRHHLDRPRRR